MPYELFWHLNPAKLAPFKSAFQKKQELDNQFAWIQGQYIRLAIGNVLNGKKCKYPDVPFDMGEEKKCDPEADFLVWIEVFNTQFEGKSV